MPSHSYADDIGRLERVAPERYKNREQAVRSFGDLAIRYAAALKQGDALADALAEDMRNDAEGKIRRDFELALKSGLSAVEAPAPSLAALFRQIATVPEWVDWDRIDRGGSLLLARGNGARAVLAAALAAGYNSAASVKPLVRTRRFIDLAAKRGNETASWYYKTLRPGGLRPNAPGFEASIRVRLVHAMVRYSLKHSDSWNEDAWGSPLNMGDTMRGIAMEFTIVPADAARVLGYDITSDDIDAFLHLFRYVGYLIGVPEDLLPKNEWEAREISALIELTNDGPDENCRELINSLLDIGYDAMMEKKRPVAARVIRSLSHGYVRAFAGDTVADRLGIHDNVFKHMPFVLRPFARRQDKALRRLSQPEISALARDYADKMIADLNGAEVVDPRQAALDSSSRANEARVLEAAT